MCSNRSAITYKIPNSLIWAQYLQETAIFQWLTLRHQSHSPAHTDNLRSFSKTLHQLPSPPFILFSRYAGCKLPRTNEMWVSSCMRLTKLGWLWGGYCRRRGVCASYIKRNEVKLSGHTLSKYVDNIRDGRTWDDRRGMWERTREGGLSQHAGTGEGEFHSSDSHNISLQLSDVAGDVSNGVNQGVH